MNTDNPILVPVVTPFKADGSVNYDALSRLTEKVLKEGANGIYAGGSSAECFLLTDDERKKTLETIIEAANGAFIVAHVGNIGTDKSIELAHHAEKAGADAIASVPPFYYNYGFAGIKSYYADLAASVDIPTLVYNVPAVTGVNMTIPQLIELMNIDKVDYLKFTATDYYMMEQVATATGKYVYSGCDECFLSAVSAGAQGGIGTTYNFMVSKYVRIMDAYKKGDMETALKIQKSANAITRAAVDNGCLAATKYLLTLQGIDAGTVRRPFIPLTDEQKAIVKAAYEKNIEI